MRAVLTLAGILPALAACGPVSVEQAERACADRARTAASPIRLSEAAFGSDGMRAAVDIDINTDTLSGRDPSALYNACVLRRSGQPPRQPLYTRPDWKG